MNNDEIQKIGGFTKSYWEVGKKLMEYEAEVSKLWLWLLSVVNHKENEIDFPTGKGRTKVKVLPGQYCTGIPSLVKRTKISFWKIRSSLKILSDIGLISIKCESHYSIISIAGWKDQYSFESVVGRKAIIKKTARQYPDSFPVGYAKSKNKVDRKAIIKKTATVLRIPLRPEKRSYAINLPTREPEKAFNNIPLRTTQMAPGSCPPVSKVFLRQFRIPGMYVDVIAEWNNFCIHTKRNYDPFTDKDVFRRFKGWIDKGLRENMLEMIPVYQGGMKRDDQLDDLPVDYRYNSRVGKPSGVSADEVTPDARAAYCFVHGLSNQASKDYRQTEKGAQAIGSILGRISGNSVNPGLISGPCYWPK